MQATIDPNVGQDVVGAMKKEIHRMKLRHQELIRQQEKLISDMERAIHKREFIANKGRAGQQKGRASLTEAGLKKSSLELQRRIKDTNKKAKMFEKSSKEKALERDARSSELDYELTNLNNIQESEGSLLLEIGEIKIQKELSLLNTVLNQKKLKWFEDVKQGKYKTLGDAAKVRAEKEKAVSINEKLLDASQKLQEKFPDIAKELSKVESILSSKI